jgi:predicted acetyltransferase
LSARTYGTVDELVLDVADGFRPESGGRFRLTTRTDGAACERLAPDDPTAADLSMDTSALASLVLGTVSPSVLSAAHRIRATPEALVRADACFGTGLAPFGLADF